MAGVPTVSSDPEEDDILPAAGIIEAGVGLQGDMDRCGAEAVVDVLVVDMHVVADMLAVIAATVVTNR